MRKDNSSVMVLLVALVLSCSWRRSRGLSQEKQSLMVGITLLPHALALGAVCLDGSPPAYHFHRGFGSGSDNWLLQFEGGGWCNDVPTCLERSRTRHGSSRYMNKLAPFAGILSNDPTMNPDFYNWNRVKLRYCDGASFTGDSAYKNGMTVLYFRGQRIWNAIIQDLLPKGLIQAKMVLLSGCSAGGLATFHHCNNLADILPKNTTFKCMSDAGFFLDINDVSSNNFIRGFFNAMISLQGTSKNLNENCKASHPNAYQCFFPEYALGYITKPYFILNAAYDVYQFHHIFVPPAADPHGHWNHCKFNIASCTPDQISILQGLRSQMIRSLSSFSTSKDGGMFINSCFAHCQSESQDTWFSPNSPIIHNKTIAEAVGDWYFNRRAAKLVDCPYPCDSTCHNVLVSNKINFEDGRVITSSENS